YFIQIKMAIPSGSSNDGAGYEKFGLQLYNEISKSDGRNENVFLSPASMALAMSMCTAKAKNETLAQMLITMNYKSITDLNCTAQTVMEVILSADEGDIKLKLANRVKISDVERQLMSNDNNRMLYGNAFRQEEILFYLPKFKMECSFELTPVLMSLGIQHSFKENADFSGITNDPEGLVISKVVHKAFIEVNEEDSEAATAAVMLT
ncbi:unnamed protein product, partial [Didymodactylos carnosus]